MNNDIRNSAVVPIRAHLAAIEVVGDLEERNSTKRRDHFVVVSVDDGKVAKSEKKPRQPSPLWEWPEDQQFQFHPSSTIKIAIYRKSWIPFIKHLVGQHTGMATELVENNATVDLKDWTGSRIASQSKIRVKLSLLSEPEDRFISFMKTVDADVSRMESTVPASVSTSALGTLGTALQFTKNIMNAVSGAHPILQASWTVMSAAYMAVQQTGLQDDAIRDLAERLREMLGVANKTSNLLVIESTTNVVEEIGRISLKIASFIHEYTRHSLAGRAVRYQLSDNMKSRIAQHQKSCEDLQRKFDRRVNIDMHRQIKMIKDDQLAEKIRQWLSAPDSSKNYYEAREKHQEGTCSWFLDGARFHEFQNKANFLWIKGKAGCGKTILSSSIIEKIIEIHKQNKSIYCAYFFFDGRDSGKDLQLHENLIRSLILQLSFQCDGIPDPLVELYGQGHKQPSLSSLEDTLHRIIGGLGSTYIIIDSLDECTQRGKTLPWINRIVSRPMENLHIVVASRPERDIVDILQPLDPHYVDLVSESENHDIRMYLEQQLSLVQKWDDKMRGIIKAKLTEGAQGMFRWVELQLMELKTCSNPDTVMKQLDDLPAGLNETYDRILLKVKKTDRTDTKTFLRWLCFSIRPVELREIAETVTVDLEAENGPQYIESRRYWDERDVLEKCSGLISESEGIVKLAHFSIKEYLLSDSLSVGAASYFHLTSEIVSHSLIAQTCLAYLLMVDTIPSGSMPKSAVLAEYAAEHWTIHARLGDINEPKQSTTSTLAKKLCTPGGAAFKNWVCTWNLDREWTWERKNPDLTNWPSPLYYASLAGLWHVVNHQSDHRVTNAQEGRYGTALQAALAKGHETIAKLLVEKGADVNAEGGVYGSALIAALYNGHRAITNLLVDKGANVNARGGNYGNALEAASGRGYEAIAKLLVDKGADVNGHGQQYGNALRAASAGGHDAIAKLLVDKGADVNAQGGGYETALHAASTKGHKAIAKLLVDKGADVNAQGGEYGNALLAALAKGHEAIAKLLVEHGADVNAQGGYHGSALCMASVEGREAMAKLLVDKGADINAEGGIYGNALQAALYGGHEAIARLLVDNGADINAQGEWSGNALHEAIANGNEAIAKLLVELGADVNAQKTHYDSVFYAASILEDKAVEEGADVNARGVYYISALYAASTRGHEAIAKLLVNNGADVNAQGGEYGNALQAASTGGHEAIAKLLLDKGADVNAQGGRYYDNALQAALAGGHVAIAKLLVDKGANINAKGGVYGNALCMASDGGHEAIAKLLVDKGADINAQFEWYGNALQLASANGHNGIAKLLVENGADVNTQGGEYGNALCAASNGGHEAIAKLLLDKGADINAEGGMYGNALCAASNEGHEAIAKLLVDKGADVNAQGDGYGNALQLASAKGHNGIAKLLVQNGADVNAQGGEYGNALQAASAGGHVAIARLLLVAGADVNAEGGPYSNALQAASSAGGLKAIAKLLVDKQAEVGALSYWEYEAPRRSAEGCNAIAQLLVRKGANVNAQGGEYGNALQVASALGNKVIARLLLNAGADVNAQGGRFGNALQAASAKGDLEITKLLMKKGADVNALGGHYGTALSAASARGHQEVQDLLVENGALMERLVLDSHSVESSSTSILP